MTWAEYAYYSHGVMERKYEAWEHTRLLASCIINTVSKKAVKPSDIIKLPSDIPNINADTVKDVWQKGLEVERLMNLKKAQHGNSGD